MPRRWRRFSKRRRYGGFKRRRNGRSARSSRFYRRSAKAIAYKAIKRMSELKHAIYNTADWPLEPAMLRGVQSVVNQTFGSCYQGTVGLRPWVFCPTQGILQGVGQGDFIGNRFMIHKLSFYLDLHIDEGQTTHDNVLFRVSVLKLKHAANPLTSFPNSADYVRNLYYGGMSAFSISGFRESTNQWSTLPWDKNKCTVLYDKRRNVHAEPITISTQILCHFKLQRFKFRKSWKRGLLCQLDTARAPELTNSVATMNPIVVIVQMMENVNLGPGSQDMVFRPSASSYLHVAFRDM